jgi:Histidine kinase/Histidine kinase-, DNA gyrase B-, and HSP90-like ATPase
MSSPPEVIASAHSPAAPKSRRSRFAVRGMRSAVFGVVIALLLTGGFGLPLWPNVVQSVCIAVSCWFAIDLGRIPLAKWAHRNDPPDSPEAQSHWPGWPLMMIAIFVGTVVGFSVGNAIGSMILGTTMPGYFLSSWRQVLATLIGSLVPGMVITYWFYSREAIAAKDDAIQTAKRQAAEHQLKLLESQLEPHMLFNTLANLRVLISIDPPRAQAMLDQLIAFLRATLSGSRASSHPLSSEFARLGDYLSLMQVRMGERLQTHFELPESLADTQVPPLLLQPLVENSIKHGLEPAIEGGRIEVSAAREGGDLVLRVRDTGAGIPRGPDPLSIASKDGAEPRADGAQASTKFGLNQVRERLATLYGARASLTLEDVGSKDMTVAGRATGTLATIRLPLVR